VTDILTFWGQFIDHDLDFSPDTATSGCVPFNIPIPKGDPFYDPLGTGSAMMTFCRTGIGKKKKNLFNQIKIIVIFKYPIHHQYSNITI
jgi:hypothetical protein